MSEPTLYLIFEAVNDDKDDSTAFVWRAVGDVRAHSSDAALRAYFANPPIERSGLYVAVSARSFQPKRVGTKVQTTISESEFVTAE